MKNYVIGAVFVTASCLTAQVDLVTWGPTTDYVTSTQASQRGSAGGVISFDMDTPLSPLDTNYSGGVFYGGADSAPSMNTGFGVFNNAFFGNSLDSVLWGRSTGVTAGHTVSGVVLWKQEDFLNLSSASDNVQVTSLSYSGTTAENAAINNEARFVLQQGSSYMISDDVGLSVSTFSVDVQTQTLDDLSSVNWYEYDPTASISNIGALVGSPTFGDVTALGLFLTAEATEDDVPINVLFNSFSAQGTAIPEPGTYALLVGLGIIGIIAYRRK